MKENLPKPTIETELGLAWKYDLESFRKKSKKKVDASIVSWLIQAMWAHPFWHSYALHLIHLRPLKGVETKIYLEGATHEIMLFALDPGEPRDLNRLPSHLQPANFVAQFISLSDSDAVDKIEKCVKEICDGELSPDTDFTQHWIHRFNASMIKGDSSRAGETIIRTESKDGSISEIVHDPAPLSKKPDTNAKPLN